MYVCMCCTHIERKRYQLVEGAHRYIDKHFDIVHIQIYIADIATIYTIINGLMLALAFYIGILLLLYVFYFTYYIVHVFVWLHI